MIVFLLICIVVIMLFGGEGFLTFLIWGLIIVAGVIAALVLLV